MHLCWLGKHVFPIVLKRFSLSSGIVGLFANRDLLWSLTVRDILSKYRGTALGFLWALLYPLMMLAVYAFVFAGVFKSRWSAQGGVDNYVLMLYCGLIVHAVFAETLNRSPGAVLSYPSYVKKVVFPLELLPACHLLSAIFNATIGLGLLCVFMLVQQHFIPLTSLFTPLMLFPLLLMTIGMAWFLAAIGVFFRDIGQIIGVIMSVMLFLSPIFYPVTSAPPFAQDLIYLNPLTYPIEEVRNVLLLGGYPHWFHWLAYTSVSACVFALGLWIFQRTRPAFADVI